MLGFKCLDLAMVYLDMYLAQIKIIPVLEIMLGTCFFRCLGNENEEDMAKTLIAKDLKDRRE